MPATVDRLERHEIGRVRAAAHHAARLHPGAVGLLLARELTAYAEFGRRFPRDGITEAAVREILRTAVPDRSEPATHRNAETAPG